MLREERVEARAIAGADGLVVLASGERQYRALDKTSWGDGPWRDEPDKIQWVDPATDLDCLLVRGQSGAWCGYVGVPETHPWFDHPYDRSLVEGGNRWEDAPDGLVEVHGGLTYSDRCQEGGDERQGVCHVAGPGRPEPVWWFGWDASHSGDFCPKMHADLCNMAHKDSYFAGYRVGVPRNGDTYRDVAYVREQVANLAAQLAAIASAGSEGR